MLVVGNNPTKLDKAVSELQSLECASGWQANFMMMQVYLNNLEYGVE